MEKKSPFEVGERTILKIIRVNLCTRLAIPIFGAKKKGSDIMENWLEKATKKFLGYDPNVWVRDFFDPKTGGYVVVNRDRWVKAVKYKNEGGKYENEFAVARVFASNGYAMEMLKEVSGISSPDVTINGVPAEIKCVKSAANMVRYARKATRKQGARIVLFEIQKRTDHAQCEFKILTKMKIHGMYFVSGSKQIYTF